MTNQRTILTLATAAIAAGALTVALWPSEAAVPSDIQPLVKKLRRFDTLYLEISHPLNIPSSETSSRVFVYAAGDGRVTLDLDDQNEHRYYFDGATVHAFDRDPPIVDHLAEPTAEELAPLLRELVRELQGGFPHFDVVRAAPAGAHQGIYGTYLRFDWKAGPMSLVPYLLVDGQAVPTGATVSGIPEPWFGGHTDHVPFTVRDLSVNVPVPLDTFTRVRPHGQLCMHREASSASTGTCVPPHVDPIIENCLGRDPLMDSDPGEDDDQHDDDEHKDDSQGDNQHEKRPGRRAAADLDGGPSLPCVQVHPLSRPSVDYKKNGPCAAYGRVTPDGIPGC